MNCNECLELVDALIDGELSPGETRLMTEHVDGCTRCRQRVGALRGLSNKIRRMPRFAPPAYLAGNIIAALDDAHGDGFGPTSAAIMKKVKPYVVGAALGAALSATLSVLVLYFFVITPLTQKFETREIVSAHLRSMMGRELVEVASADRHILKPWFAGRLDFAPRVVSLAHSGFPLKGARTDYLFDGRVAAVVYTRRGHKINLFIAPAKRGSGSARGGRARAFVANGFNVEEFVQGDYRYIAISDLNGRELAEFTALLTTSYSPKPD